MTNPTLIGLAFLAAASLAPQGTRGAVQLEAADCSRTRTSFGTSEVAHAVRHERVPMAIGTLDVRPGGNGGVRIEAGSGDTYAITACITAGADSVADAQRVADAVTLTVAGNRVRVSAPDQARNWGVQLIVEAPRGAQMDVETSNGPIGIRGVEGSITARAVNGPISLADVASSVRAVAVNGPISISGSRGNIDAETQNGPISVDLQGSRWDGELNARAKNGPLSLRLPEGFGSGVEVSSSRRSPWNCRIAACSGLPGSSDDEVRTLRMGSGAPAVKLSTVNGPVSLDHSR
jgi:DUF4097 and DUF4098 domain-containing protein YvlB